MGIVATTSLPAVDRPNADHWNAARSCQKRKECCFCGHYVIASSRPPKRQPLERRTLVPIVPLQISLNCSLTLFLFNNSLHLRVLLQNISNWCCLYHVLWKYGAADCPHCCKFHHILHMDEFVPCLTNFHQFRNHLQLNLLQFSSDFGCFYVAFSASKLTL